MGLRGLHLMSVGNWVLFASVEGDSFSDDKTYVHDEVYDGFVCDGGGRRGGGGVGG